MSCSHRLMLRDDTVDVTGTRGGAIRPDNDWPYTMNNKKLWILFGMIGVIGLVMIAWLTGSRQESVEQRYDIDLPDSHQTSATGDPAVEKLEARVGQLVDRVDALTHSIDVLESRVLHDQEVTAPTIYKEQDLAGQAPPAVTIMPGTTPDLEQHPRPAADETGRGAGVVISPRPASIMEPQGPVTPDQPAASTGKAGPWVINLASSQSKADADRLAERARSRDIQTEQQQVTVNGKHYWRVQITGFTTAAEAREYAGTIKAKLGLKDVWISTR